VINTAKVIDKTALEMINLRNRIIAQREEIKRLQAEVKRLKDKYEPN